MSDGTQTWETEMTRKEMDESLSGTPGAILVTRVRRTLKSYGVVPNDRTRWRLAWEWARVIRDSYRKSLPPGMTHRDVDGWPRSNEIAAQYMALLLAEMRDNFALNLPYRAPSVMPVAVAVRLADTSILALGCPAKERRPEALPAAPLVVEGVLDAELI